jgi:atypical dual specificity phosphatase
MMQELDYDLSLLRTAGITMLVTLTETPLDDDALAAQGLKSLFFPIVDMHAPSLRAAYELCGLIDLQLARGERIAFHCKAGLGRTGTLLCSYLIWKGEGAEAALRQARRVEPAWVQSKEQEQFLQAFEGFCANQRQEV